MFQLAAKSYKEIGDDARTYYLEKIVELANTEGDGEITNGKLTYSFFFYK